MISPPARSLVTISLRPGESSEPTLTAALRSAAKRTHRSVLKFLSCALKKGAVAMRGHHG
jgi:hypothetical protein